MDSSGKDPVLGHSSLSSSANASLRENFITAANALTAMYKRSERLEREARVQGAKAAYTAVLEFALSQQQERGVSTGISASDLFDFCREELQKMSGTADPYGGLQFSDPGGPPPLTPPRSPREVEVMGMDRKNYPRKRLRSDTESDVVMDVSGLQLNSYSPYQVNNAEVVTGFVSSPLEARKDDGYVRNGSTCFPKR